ncbi:MULTISPECIES: hypothetical protein [unclassified Lentimonas]|uniref:hypothetical protein n=1 Tax=unclassified Lentimonas TaxID=2630993 RepID=UPI001325CCBA|nr:MULTISPECIES: hypothetical protein [unclassified Lentimonas]CAA6679822.1 Unannotated [Lentimonas sp. CC4]CAA6685666.1 Unannotated [Lentimonas sp. CC6]CAA7077110.1 Unannotated [Lentimonas sp. CC4]CAA7168808.1 Unannotated [Lentimonas sp. CC21]CAA7180826.1 Unannotated [Lentimonas sp. CC8]
MKALIGVGILLIVIGLLGKVSTTTSMAAITTEISKDANNLEEYSEQIAENRQKADIYRWVTISGVVVFFGSRVVLRAQARRAKNQY